MLFVCKSPGRLESTQCAFIVIIIVIKKKKLLVEKKITNALTMLSDPLNDKKLLSA